MVNAFFKKRPSGSMFLCSEYGWTRLHWAHNFCILFAAEHIIQWYHINELANIIHTYKLHEDVSTFGWGTVWFCAQPSAQTLLSYVDSALPCLLHIKSVRLYSIKAAYLWWGEMLYFPTSNASNFSPCIAYSCVVSYFYSRYQTDEGFGFMNICTDRLKAETDVLLTGS